MNNGGKLLETLFEEFLGPIVNWAIVAVLAVVAGIAACLWFAVFVL